MVDKPAHVMNLQQSPVSPQEDMHVHAVTRARRMSVCHMFAARPPARRAADVQRWLIVAAGLVNFPVESVVVASGSG